MSALAGRVDAAVAGADARERTALERREIDGIPYAGIAEELGVKREAVADLLVAARLKVAEAVDGVAAPSRPTKQCGPARRVVAAQQDGEAVGARDLDRAAEHIDGCGPCQDARVALQAARLACRTWSTTEPAAPEAPAAPAPDRRRLAALGAFVVLVLVVVAVALGGGDSGSTPPAPAAPPVGQGSADADAQDVVPPPGDQFCLPDEPGCP